MAVFASTGFFHLTSPQAWGLILFVGVMGWALGPVLARWTNRLCETPAASNLSIPLALVTGILFAFSTILIVRAESQWVAEVVPDVPWRFGRLGFHLVLLFLLIAATATDFREYVIPDQITMPGTLFGVVGAMAAGDVQLIHLWVDWNHPFVEQSGQYVPEWIAKHPHWHGLAWSVAGGLTGAGITWVARWISSQILNQEAMGLGDVTLMGMIGSFLGWQPVLIVFALAPFCGLIAAGVAHLISQRTYIPYGPYLSGAAALVVVFWKWIWQWEPLPRVAIRRLFGDAIGLGILIGVAFVLLLVLLSLVRWWKNTPAGNISSVNEDQ